MGAREEEPIDLAGLSDGSGDDDIVVTGTSLVIAPPASEQASARESRQVAAGGTFDREMERESADQSGRAGVPCSF